MQLLRLPLFGLCFYIFLSLMPSLSKCTSVANEEGEADSFAQTLAKVEQVRKLVGGDISVPQICVVGDQSSGKSALLTAISNITFPSAAGVTTRCPAIVTLEKSEEQSVTINGERKTEHELQKGVDYKKEILKAQENLLQVQPGLKKSMAVTENPVLITISGPSFNPLVLVDLPGIIHNGEGQEEVESMIRKYLKPKETLIVVVREVNSDEETQKALSIIKEPEFDPEFQRTIQVFTKGDSFSSNANRAEVAKILFETEVEPNGAHILAVCPNGGTHDKKKEISILRSYPELRHLKNVGIDSLEERLPRLLSERMKENLPHLRDKIFVKWNEEKVVLDKVGNTCPDVHEVLRSIRRGIENYQYELKNSLTSTFEDFSRSVMHKMENVNRTRFDDIFERSSNMFEPGFLQGKVAFETVSRELTSKLEIDVEKLIQNLQSDLRESIQIQTIYNLSPVLSSKISEAIFGEWLVEVKDICENVRKDILAVLNNGDISRFTGFKKSLRFKDESPLVNMSCVYEKLLQNSIKSIDEVVESASSPCAMSHCERAYHSLRTQIRNSKMSIDEIESAISPCTISQCERVYQSLRTHIKNMANFFIQHVAIIIHNCVLEGQTKWLSNLEHNEKFHNVSTEDEWAAQRRERSKQTIDDLGEALKILESI